MTGAFCPFVDEEAELSVSQPRRAIKGHCCVECDGEIAPGDTYQETRLLYEGRWDRYRTCQVCLDGPVAWVRRHCGTYYIGGIFDHLGEVFADRVLTHPGTQMKVGRWIIESRRRSDRRRAAQRSAKPRNLDECTRGGVTSC